VQGLRKRLNIGVVVSAVLFLVFDATVLGIGYWMAKQVEADAITINLAGRQRMLTQRMVKALLQIHVGENAAVSAEAARDELAHAVSLFDETLTAFAHGGAVRGGDGRPLFQAALTGSLARDLVARMQREWVPYRDRLVAIAAGEVEAGSAQTLAAAAVAGEINLVLLDLANRVTSEVEAASRAKTQRLRVLQVVAFVLALINFFIMLNIIWRRVSGLHTSHREAHRLARIDALTGLTNRIGLLEHLETGLATLRDDSTGMAIGFLDLNRFKQVNDSHGHAVGDSVLRQVAQRMRRRLRKSDLISRIGGDEFVVVLHDISQPDEAAPILDALGAAMARPFVVHGDEIEIGLSIGAILVRSGGVEPDELLRQADRLMYEVKAEGVSHWRLMEFLPGSDQLVKA
jgi:diguanylate cyclase (GGDEF)-like protein